MLYRGACQILQSRCRGLLWLALLSLVACTPTHDWRELPAAAETVRVAFPAVPVSETRTLPIEGISWPFTLSVAEAGGAVFAVGHLDLSPASQVAPAITADAIGKALVLSLTRHFPPDRVQHQTVRIRALQPGRSGVEGVEVRAENPSDPGAPRLQARVFRHSGRWIQVVALGLPLNLPWETASWFVESVRLP